MSNDLPIYKSVPMPTGDTETSLIDKEIILNDTLIRYKIIVICVSTQHTFPTTNQLHSN